MRSDSQFAPTKRQAGWWSLLVVVFLLVCLFFAPPGLAAEFLVSLKPAVASQGFSYVSIVDTPVISPFSKEPAGTQVVRRGKLSLGSKPLEHVAYWWGANGTLRLDVNGNGDLTDDPSAVYKTAQVSKSWGFTSATFPNVLWPQKAGADRRALLVDLNLWESGARRAASANQRSYDSGKLEMEGKAWEIGLLESPEGSSGPRIGLLLLIRPWEDRSERFTYTSPFTDVVRVGKRLYFGGRCFEVATGETSTGLSLKLTEITSSLGELTLDGSQIGRVVLESAETVVILDRPGKTVQVPVGRYRNLRVRLGSGTNAAFMEVGGANRETVIAADRPRTLNIGGPLLNTATVQQRGPCISLSYSLVGLGHEPYLFRDETRANPPRFAIYQAGKKVASGKFEYG